VQLKKRPFHNAGPTTEKARLFMIEVRANGSTPSPAEHRDSGEQLLKVYTQVDKGQVGKLERGLAIVIYRNYDYTSPFAQQGSTTQNSNVLR